MLITPHPGVDSQDVLRTLSLVGSRAEDLADNHREHIFTDYLEWANDSARALHCLIRDADIRSLIYTDRYRLLLTASMGEPTDNQQRVVLTEMARLELEQCGAQLDAAIETFSAHVHRWRGSEALTVADSSFYIQHPTKLEETDFRALLRVKPRRDVRLLAPIIVVDELDRLKEASKPHPRWRAGYTLAVLEDTVGTSGFGSLGPTGTGKAGVAVEVVFDPVGHTRLPDADDEIVDRCLAIQSVAGRPVTLITYDTGQAMRARTGGLQVLKLRLDLESPQEPDRVQQSKPGTGVRAQRRERQAAQNNGAT
ncbi:PIN domain-containing protein [Streptomyces sp. NPDC058695]|uniref:PIN domain-containing protein n=1 Tax=Streptomyces sp. NPDC058695 TaxID=3346604 RepID=UPI0036683B66